MGCHFLLQGIFLTQGLNPHLLCLLHWQVECFTTATPGMPPTQFWAEVLNIKEWVNEWVRLPWGLQKNYGQPVLYQPVVINISSFPVTPTALDLFWKTFINHILEIPHSSQAKLSHVRGLQKSPSCLSNMVSCLTSFTCHCSFLWIGNSLLFLAKKKKGKAGSAPTRQRRKHEEKSRGNSDTDFHRPLPLRKLAEGQSCSLDFKPVKPQHPLQQPGGPSLDTRRRRSSGAAQGAAFPQQSPGLWAGRLWSLDGWVHFMLCLGWKRFGSFHSQGAPEKRTRLLNTSHSGLVPKPTRISCSLTEGSANRWKVL